METPDVQTIFNNFKIDKRELLNMVSVEEGDLAYISGSIVEGFGNPYSDLDIFVIKKTIENVEAQFIKDDFRIRIIVINNTRFDVEYHPMDKVLRYVSLTQQFNPTSHEEMDRLNLDIIDFLHRLRIAIPIYGEQQLKSLQSAISLENLCACLKNWQMRTYNSNLMDCKGMLDINDLDTCVSWARQTLCNAVDVCLAVNLDTNPSEKWRFRKLERLLGKNSSIYQNYQTYLLKQVPEYQKKEYIEEILTFASDLVLNSQLQTWR